jgi:hypothetical protein
MRGDSIEFVRRGTRAGTVQMQSNGSRSWDDFWRDDLYAAIRLDAACPRVGQAELSGDSTVKQAFCRELSRGALYIKRCSTERWHTDHRQTWVDDSCFVVLNDGELYSQGLRAVQVRAFRGLACSSVCGIYWWTESWLLWGSGFRGLRERRTGTGRRVSRILGSGRFTCAPRRSRRLNCGLRAEDR